MHVSHDNTDFSQLRIAPTNHRQQAHDIKSRKASVGMHSGRDYPYKSCHYVLFGPPIPTSSFNFILIQYEIGGIYFNVF